MIDPKEVIITFLDEDAHTREVNLDEVLGEIGWEYSVSNIVLSLAASVIKGEGRIVGIRYKGQLLLSD